MLNRKLMIELLLKSKRVCVVIYNFEIIKSRSSIVRVQIPPWTNISVLKSGVAAFRPVAAYAQITNIHIEIFIYSLPKNNVP